MIEAASGPRDQGMKGRLYQGRGYSLSKSA
jgi:hypothetical protein